MMSEIESSELWKLMCGPGFIAIGLFFVVAVIKKWELWRISPQTETRMDWIAEKFGPNFVTIYAAFGYSIGAILGIAVGIGLIIEYFT